jgi:hypothetical protein
MKILIAHLICITTIILLEGCDSRKNETVTNTKNVNEIRNNSKEKIPNKKVIKNEFLDYKEDTFEGYNFEFGYEKYDEDKFGFENPGFFQIMKNGKVIFKDSFKGEGEVYVKSLGYHDLFGKKLIFTFNWGTEACDYSQHSRYYVITPDSKVDFLKECWSMSGGDGYASRYYEHIFPEESFGMENSLLIVEGMKYHEHDQPDLYDTTSITFSGDQEFGIIKPTNNLDKSK